MFGGPIWFIIHVMVYNWFYGWGYCNFVCVVMCTFDDKLFKSIYGVENRYVADVEFNEEFGKLGGVLYRPLFNNISPL